MNHLNPTEIIQPGAAGVLEDADDPIVSRDTAEASVHKPSSDAPRVAKPTSVTQEVLPPDPYAHLRPMAAARVIREMAKAFRNAG